MDTSYASSEITTDLEDCDLPSACVEISCTVVPVSQEVSIRFKKKSLTEMFSGKAENTDPCWNGTVALSKCTDSNC